MLRNPKRLTVLAATLTALAVPSIAQADSTAQLSGLNCSVTANTPYYAGSGVLGYTGGTSCGGSQAGYEKTIAIGLWDLVTGGWQPVRGMPYGPWTTVNPDRVAAGWSCVPGRWYATAADGEAYGGGVSAAASAFTFNSGYKCR